MIISLERQARHSKFVSICLILLPPKFFFFQVLFLEFQFQNFFHSYTVSCKENLSLRDPFETSRAFWNRKIVCQPAREGAPSGPLFPSERDSSLYWQTRQTIGLNTSKSIKSTQYAPGFDASVQGSEGNDSL